MQGCRPAVFLDRDGVLNRPIVLDGRPFPPATAEELEILDGVPEACAALRNEGFLLIVVTNQPDVARGTTTMGAISAIHAALEDKVAVDAVLVCPHDDDDRCECRKPAPGLLLAAAERWGIDLARSVMVGDRWKDIEAGRRAGCGTVFVDGGYVERRPEGQDMTVASFPDALPWIIARRGRERGSDVMTGIGDLKVKIFADGADREGIAELADHPLIKGFTTNPSLMRSAGVEDYERFAREVLKIVPDYPVSFEVLSDDLAEMERQALKIAAWGDNVYVKIPITNCRGESSGPLLRRLIAYGVRLNVTALMTPAQVRTVAGYIGEGPHAFVSLFAGRIADTGRDPLPLVAEALQALAPFPNLELIWASPREILNLFQADEAGCHVITVTHDLLRKLPTVGKDLNEFSLETVQMFFNDAQAAGYAI